MMATYRLNRRQTGYVLAGSMSLNMALAAAFFIVAMPYDFFESLVIASGAPALIAAAQPPLGETVRLAVAGGFGLLVGAATVLLLLLSDRREAGRGEATARSIFADAAFDTVVSPAAVSDEAPSLPDPIVVEPVAIPRFMRSPAVAMPSEPEPVAADDTPIFVDFRAIRAAGRAAADEPLDLAQWKVVEAREEAAVKNTEPVAEAPAPAPATPPAATTAADDSIAALMSRLEAGLDRRSEKGTNQAEAPALPKSAAGLNSTLDELRKMAVRR